MPLLLSRGDVRPRAGASVGEKVHGLSRGLESPLRHSVSRAVVYVLRAPRPSPQQDIRDRPGWRVFASDEPVTPVDRDLSVAMPLGAAAGDVSVRRDNAALVDLPSAAAPCSCACFVARHGPKLRP